MQKLHVQFQSTDINNDNILKGFNKQHFKGIHKGNEYFKKYKSKDWSHKCFNDKNTQFVPTIDTADKCSSTYISKDNHLN